MSWENSIDEQIRAAMERGDFDNLPGKGRPMGREQLAAADENWLANKILKDNGFAPPLLEAGKQIQADLAYARKRLARARQWQLNDRDLGVAEARLKEKWETAAAAFGEEVAALNKRIRTHNLKAPPALHLPFINIDHEFERL